MKSDALINEMLAAVDAEKSRATMETDRACSRRKETKKKTSWAMGRLLLDRKPRKSIILIILLDIWLVVSNIQICFIFTPI